MNKLLIEIGNTALKAVWAQGSTLGKTYRYQGEHLMDFIKSVTDKEKPEIMAVASARPVSAGEERMLRNCCSRLMILDSEHKDILRKYQLPEYLSYDRAASLIAVRNMFKGQKCTVFDFGTTMTVDFLGQDGSYEGGNISLGCRTRFKALNRYSKSLPLIDTPSEIEQKGHSIRESIESGVISGIMFEIDGYIRHNGENIVVFTGGDAIYFAKKMKNPIFAICNLGLIGLAHITEDYVE